MVAIKDERDCETLADSLLDLLDAIYVSRLRVCAT